MDDDGNDADMAPDASPPASSDTKMKSKKQMHSEGADGNGSQQRDQEVAMKAKGDKIKKRKAVINDSDDD